VVLHHVPTAVSRVTEEATKLADFSMLMKKIEINFFLLENYLQAIVSNFIVFFMNMHLLKSFVEHLFKEVF